MIQSDLKHVSLQQKETGVEMQVRVSTGAKKSLITGTWQNAVRISISAPPRDGKANKALCSFCAEFFGITRKQVTILRGKKSRQKTLLLKDQNPAKIRSMLADVIEDTDI